MVITFGNNIIDAYTGGVQVKEIYANGVKVWPTEPIPNYYLRYSPSNITGVIWLGSYTLYSYNFSDYSGEITWSGIGSTEGYSGNWSYNIHSTLTSIETNAETIGYQTFADCSALQTISLPNCLTVGEGAFSKTKFLSIYLPECEVIAAFAFRGYSSNPMTVRDTVDLPKCGYIGRSAFRDCHINYMYLRSESVVSVGGDILGGNGFIYRIYVPSSLVSDYINNQYWSNYSAKIYPIQ